MTPLAKTLLRQMPKLTHLRSIDRAMENAHANLPYLGATISDLAGRSASCGTSFSAPMAARSAARGPAEPSQTAVVVAAGPSLHRRRSLARLLDSGYDGFIIAADGALGHCLRSGVIPDYVVTLDPHPTRICRWFGDPELASHVNGDDYFRRQDLDPYLATDELQRNQELISLVNRHGASISVAICTSVHPRVSRRCLEAGMTLYWWNPLLDDVEDEQSMTRALYQLTRVPCMVSGGNGGTAAWIFAHQVLGIREVAVVGMDFSYPPGTPLERTQYYTELKELFGARAHEALVPVQNPHTNETWYADPTYYWYRECFLAMASQTDCVTHNCTEGGILFGDAVRWTSLEDFLKVG